MLNCYQSSDYYFNVHVNKNTIQYNITILHCLPKPILRRARINFHITFEYL